MKKIINFLKNNKIIIIPIGLIMIFISTLLLNSLYKEQNKDSNQIEYIEYEKLTISDLNESTPLLYDFYYSCMGFKSDKDFNVYGSFYMIALNKEDLNQNKGVFFIERYNSIDFFPGLGTYFEEYKCNKKEWKKINNLIISWPSDKILYENDWIFLIITEGDKDYNYKKEVGANVWQDINLNDFDYKDGITSNEMNGWDTEWLRREPYYTNIKNRFNTDLKDDFFDKFKLFEKMEKYNNKGEKIEIQVVGKDKFTCDLGVNFYKNLDELNNDLNKNGYEKVER